jgi:hypothetical protein
MPLVEITTRSAVIHDGDVRSVFVIRVYYRPEPVPGVGSLRFLDLSFSPFSCHEEDRIELAADGSNDVAIDFLSRNDAITRLEQIKSRPDFFVCEGRDEELAIQVLRYRLDRFPLFFGKRVELRGRVRAFSFCLHWFPLLWTACRIGSAPARSVDEAHVVELAV